MGGGRPERRIDGEGRSYCPWRLGASILAESAEERLGWRLGKVEEVVGNFYAQGIEASDRREEIDGRGGGGMSSARLCLEEEERELSERDKYQRRIRELKRLPTG